MRPLTICLITLVVVIALAAQPVSALTVMKIPYFRAGPVWTLNSAEHADLFIVETNMSHLAAADDEAFALSFAPVGSGAPGFRAFAPTIAQTASRAIACDQSYFYQDFSVA